MHSVSSLRLSFFQFLFWFTFLKRKLHKAGSNISNQENDLKNAIKLQWVGFKRHGEGKSQINSPDSPFEKVPLFSQCFGLSDMDCSVFQGI